MSMLEFEDDPNMMFEFANGLGAGSMMRQGQGWLSAYAQAYGTTRKAWLAKLTKLAAEGKRLERMYWEYADGKDLEDLKKTGIISSSEKETLGDESEENEDSEFEPDNENINFFSNKKNSPQNNPKRTGSSSASSSAKKRKVTANKSRTGKGKICGLTVEQHRRKLGDKIKSKIQVEKWAIEAKTHVTIDEVHHEVFRKVVLPHATEVIPSDGDPFTAKVVVVTIEGSNSIGEVFGKTKIKGGTKLGSWSANMMDIIYFPDTREMRCWWTMGESLF
mmetsp:Transcript_6854/g.9040  ORF Transcript_6854/g.9040 Transcript_6854/m.9040 type:complete len:276 (+) Transcript_6854:59-886(+)|eukprot:CAMPEP_0117879350 /NCGR_PEP_ID=MMETSP0950-20121206/15453_1 /TAXON_ID=44440 /ORGANISM="Chattonella subsalsa, Strain CCMP2191" /LENGTH=275 /DNA_ID=CAMNT_0005733951 /DNA_START=48 /DNA_END=875 /DNA_ORIENTATION=+